MELKAELNKKKKKTRNPYDSVAALFLFSVTFKVHFKSIKTT